MRCIQSGRFFFFFPRNNRFLVDFFPRRTRSKCSAKLINFQIATCLRSITARIRHGRCNIVLLIDFAFFSLKHNQNLRTVTRQRLNFLHATAMYRRMAYRVTRLCVKTNDETEQFWIKAKLFSSFISRRNKCRSIFGDFLAFYILIYVFLYFITLIRKLF